MASSSRCPPWVKDNPEQQGLVRRSQKYSQLLLTNMQELCHTIIIVGLWVYLISLGVIDTSMRRNLESRPTNEDQVAGLLEFLLYIPCWKLHAFCRALCKDHQAHVVSHILLLNPQDYKGNQEDQDQAANRKQCNKEIKAHRDVYHRTLMQGRLFDIPSLDLPYDMEPCYIKVLATSDGLLTNPEKISSADILRAKPGKPRVRTALLSGPPGAGKSSFIRYYVYKWCQTEDGESDWDLIIILNVSTLRLTSGLSPKEHIKEAIRQSLEGRGDKEAIMRSLDDDSLDILIIPDGMDEYRSATILEMLKELISSCYHGRLGFTVLSTCRSGLSQIQESLFDRRMKIDGFTREEGIKYVERFYTEIQKPDDDSMYGYIANSQGELAHILTNLLCTHILSVVTADGTLKLRKGQRLRLKTLFQAMEKSMKRRQIEKNATQVEKVMKKKEVEDQTKSFYNMSLYALLKDLRIFSQSLLAKFQISVQNPYLTFMTKKRTQRFHEKNLEHMGIITEDPLFMSMYPQLKEDSHWAYNHEMFLEFFSASALEAQPDDLRAALLLTISSDKKFRNTQRILFSVLGGDVDHLGTLSDMICVTLIAQGNFDRLDPKLKDVIYAIKVNAKASTYKDDLLNTLIPGKDVDVIVDTSKAKELWQRTKHLYEKETELLQTSGILITIVEDRYLLKHIYNCLEEVPEEHQQLVFDQSLGRTMPSTRLNEDGYRCIMYNTGGMRWSQVRESRHGVKVYINNSLTDAAEAVRQYGQEHLVSFLKDRDTRQLNNIWLTTSNSLWTLDMCRALVKPSQLLSTTLWSKLLSDISDLPITADTLVLYSSSRASVVKGFLQCLQMECTQDAVRRLLVQGEGGCLRIVVGKGHIDSESLLAWTDWYLQQDLLHVQLVHLTCQISGSDSAIRQQQQRRVDSLQHTVHNGCQLFDNLIIESNSEDIEDSEDSDGSDGSDVSDGSDKSDEVEERSIESGQLFCQNNEEDFISVGHSNSVTVGSSHRGSLQTAPQTASCTVSTPGGRLIGDIVGWEPPHKKHCRARINSSQHQVHQHHKIPAALGQHQPRQPRLSDRQSTTAVPPLHKLQVTHPTAHSPLPQLGNNAAELQESPLGSGSPQPVIINSSPEGSPSTIIIDSSPEGSPQPVIINSSPEGSPSTIIIDSSPEASPKSTLPLTTPTSGQSAGTGTGSCSVPLRSLSQYGGMAASGVGEPVASTPAPTGTSHTSVGPATPLPYPTGEDYRNMWD